MGGALVLRTKGKPFGELGDIDQATYFIARDTKKHGVYHAQGSRWGKDLASHKSQSTKVMGEKTTTNELDGWGQVIHGTDIALRFKICVKHGISNSILHQIL